MANTHKNKKSFGVSDIERYYNGKMQPREMHELEKAALEDSFLADALEGYAHTQYAVKDEAELKSRLSNKKQQKKTVGLVFRSAAMVFILAGAGWLLFEMTYKDQNKRISIRNQAEMSTSQPVGDTMETETILPKEEPAVQESRVLKQENSGTAPTSTKKPQNPVDEYEQSFKKDHFQSLEAAIDSLEGADGRNDIASATLPFHLMRTESRVFSDSGQPVQTLATKNRKSSNDKIQISNNGNQVIITIQESPDGIHEMVLSRQKKDSSVKKSPSIIIEEAEPEESWNEFGAYLSGNMRTLEDLQSEPLHGTLKLSFDVSTSGEPVNIQIENSLCKKCDAEALRLLKEGPKWKKKSKRGKVIIRY